MTWSHKATIRSIYVVGLLAAGILLAEFCTGLPTIYLVHTLAAGYLIELALWVHSTRFCVMCGELIDPEKRPACRNPDHTMHLPWSEAHTECCPFNIVERPKRSVDVAQIVHQHIYEASQKIVAEHNPK